MPKLILLVVATLFLVHPSLQLKCYNCRNGIVPSKSEIAGFLLGCPDNIQDWPTIEKPDIGFPRCMKLVEKVKLGDDEVTIIIRTAVMDKIVVPPGAEAYYCTEDLCNSGFSTKAAVAVLLLCVVAAAFIR